MNYDGEFPFILSCKQITVLTTIATPVCPAEVKGLVTAPSWGTGEDFTLNDYENDYENDYDYL